MDPTSGQPRVVAGAGLPDGYAEAMDQCWDAGIDPSHQAYLADEPLIVRDSCGRT